MRCVAPAKGRSRASASLGICAGRGDSSEHRVRATRQADSSATPTTLSRGSEVVRISIGIWKGDTPGTTSQSRRCPSPHTPRCPRSSAVQSTKSAQPGPRSGSTSGSRNEGGATPLPPGRRRPKLGRRLSPAGRRSPLAAVRRQSRRTPSIGAADCYHARSEPASVRACSAASRRGRHCASSGYTSESPGIRNVRSS